MQKLVTLVTTTDLSYNDEGKQKFHLIGRLALNEIATKMELVPGTFEIRSNKGGIAVSGEVTLHADNVYIQLSQGSFPGRFMYRHCKGQKDYTGGRNRWMEFKDLLDINAAVRQFKAAQTES